MASKGQKFRSYSSELKLEVASKAIKGRGYRSIAREYPDVSVWTIKAWVRKANNNIDVTKDGRGRSLTGRSRSKSLTLEDYKERYEILKKYQAFLQARRGKK